jgi:putative transposase
MIHFVWSTKDREPYLDSRLRNRLWPYLGGIARENDMKALAIGGTNDHVHVLVCIPSVLSVGKAAQLLKGNSSKWIHETFPKLRSFAWQKGYGAFSIGASGIDATVEYIRNQTEHHRKRSFREEFVAMLRKNALLYEEWMLE